MTRKRDEITVLEAVRTGLVVLVTIVVAMIALGLTISEQKAAAKRKATELAAAALHFAPSATRTVEAAPSTGERA